MLAPATQTVANLGALGAPATVFSVLAFLWFLAGRLTGRLTLDPASGSVRKAMCVLLAAFTVSYIGLSGRSASSLETQAADRALILLLIWCGLVVVASAGITDRARLDTLLRRLVLLGTIVAAIGIVEFFSGVAAHRARDHPRPVDQRRPGRHRRARRPPAGPGHHHPAAGVRRGDRRAPAVRAPAGRGSVPAGSGAAERAAPLRPGHR